MNTTDLYRLMEEGDGRALSLARSLTARVRSGIASPEEARTHEELVRLYARSSSSSPSEPDAATVERLRALVARARSSGAAGHAHASFGRGHGGRGHRGHGHRGWGQRGGWGGWVPYYPYPLTWAPPAPGCYWNLYGWVCPPW